MHDMRDDCRDQGYSALHFQQETSKVLPKNMQRVLFEEVQTAAALASSRTAAQMTSRFRDMENDVEANFSHQQHALQQ